MRLELSEVQRENIREYRKKKNITADLLSEKLGKSKNWFAQVERGRQKIDLEDLKRVAKELDSNVVDLIGYMPGEILATQKAIANGMINQTGTPVFDGMKLLEENMELKKENAVLKEKLRQISNICDLT